MYLLILITSLFLFINFLMITIISFYTIPIFLTSKVK